MEKIIVKVSLSSISFINKIANPDILCQNRICFIIVLLGIHFHEIFFFIFCFIIFMTDFGSLNEILFFIFIWILKEKNTGKWVFSVVFFSNCTEESFILVFLLKMTSIAFIKLISTVLTKSIIVIKTLYTNPVTLSTFSFILLLVILTLRIHVLL